MRKDRALTAEQKMEYREILTYLEGTGMTPLEAVKLGINRVANIKPTKVSDAIDALLRDNIRRKLREDTKVFYEDRLNLFLSRWPNETLDQITRSEILAWIKSLPDAAEGTKKATFRAVNRLYTFALSAEQPMCSTNPCSKLKVSDVKGERKIQILTTSEAEKILRAAEFKMPIYIPSLVLLLFAGIRPLEIRSKDKPALTWNEIKFEEKCIRIPAEISKTRNTRLIETAPVNLWNWLTLYKEKLKREKHHPILDSRIRQPQRFAKDVIGHWPKDVCRHSYATYDIALRNNIGSTSENLGHEGKTSIIHRHYKGLADRSQAGEYFNINPSQ